ncbi:DUF3604 domain-containing protein [Lysobacter niastensis]|uniref:DUF3604 domain-containing protein n=1 Tax=Lysobacter niastensis TaxID=380629 RepID=A0ABS0B8Q0_9GAMM|nr:DUF3604 domain-containing protein [Lysobacter niastensis]MBF6024021.1 DUF3604 domain-containing protein [Lysobacter niastensis]
MQRAQLETTVLVGMMSVVLLAGCSRKQPEQAAAPAAPEAAAPAAVATADYPTRVFFGDTHLHTGMSLDAGAAGALLLPADAYRFAKGEEVTGASGQKARLSRPLDFLVVSDHSDQMGLISDLKAGKPELLANPMAKSWYDMMQAGKGMEAALAIIQSFSKGTFPKEVQYNPGTPGYRSAWEATIKAAEEANQPGKFTAFIGYEWTSIVKGNNLHRNVVFRDAGDRARQVEPFTTYPPLGSPNPRDLWKWMAAYEAKTGGQVLAIPHNGNLSNGTMFALVDDFDGNKPFDVEYAKTRAGRERIYEVTQMKGDGESHPFLSPNDEFANFERWDKGNLDMSAAKTKSMLEFEYARSALKNGLMIESKLGANPYKFGLVGSTDAHTALSTADDNNFWGKTATNEPGPERWKHPFMKTDKGVILGWEQTASGYAAVWAKENTRESLFDAMQRKEVYATTGPRMTVRFFGGWDYAEADAKGDVAAIGYAKGVPMGGDLKAAAAGESPTFLVAAMKDPEGGNLDRVQVVKGWMDAKGALQEKVYDVAWSGDRKPGADGKLPPVGNTVDLANATWTNTIGSPELMRMWQDPDFDPTLRAFYYVRVIEIPTPRWTAYDTKRFNAKMDKKVPMTTQERAYTSPIWYTPAK